MTRVLLKYGHQSRSLMPLVEVKKFARLICQFCIRLYSRQLKNSAVPLLWPSVDSKAMKMHFNLTLTKNISKLNELNYYLQVDQELDPYFCSSSLALPASFFAGMTLSLSTESHIFRPDQLAPYQLS